MRRRPILLAAILMGSVIVTGPFLYLISSHHPSWPDWLLPAIVTVAWIAFALVVAHKMGFTKSYKRHGYCPHCDYDLFGNTSGVCPECGAKIARFKHSEGEGLDELPR
jgi:hypothetical protein